MDASTASSLVVFTPKSNLKCQFQCDQDERHKLLLRFTSFTIQFTIHYSVLDLNWSDESGETGKLNESVDTDEDDVEDGEPDDSLVDQIGG